MDALVLDFDGVIVDSERLHDEALRVVCAPLGIGWEGHPWVGWPDAEVMHEVLARAGMIGGTEREARVRSLLEEKTSVVLEQVRRGRYEAYPGSVELIGSAAEVAKVGVCSAGLREQILPVLEQLGVLRHLSTVVAWEDTPRGKPDPAPYRLAAERLGVRPERCIAIEDSARGVASATGAGMTVVAVGHTTHKEALGQAHRFVESIGELTVEGLRALCSARARHNQG